VVQGPGQGLWYKDQDKDFAYKDKDKVKVKFYTLVLKESLRTRLTSLLASPEKVLESC